MALLQALFAFISRSAGKILNAIFGWAVVALFGRSSPKQQTMLTILVAMAALWPLLLVGVAIPKIAAMALAFIPIPDSVPSSAVRLVWIALALAVPLLVGIVVAARAPEGGPREPAAIRLLRGFPITVGIAGAFLLMFVTVPLLRIASILRGRRDEHIPLITTGREYDEAAAEIDRLLARHGLDAPRAKPSWWLVGPTKLLLELGGKALRGFAPTEMAYWRGPDLELGLYPSDILVRGRARQTAWVQGLLAERLARGPGLMTYAVEAQEIEKQIHQIWRVHDESPRAHTDSRALLGRLDDVARDLGELKIDYDEWQIVYRKAAQLGRALHGQAQLLQSTVETKERTMNEKRPEEALVPTAVATTAVDRPLASASTTELVGQMLKQSAELVKKEVELAAAEMRADVKQEIATAKGLGVAGICALTTLNMLLIAAIFGLARLMPDWGAALLVAAVVVIIGGIAFAVGWGKRVKRPLDKTQRTVKEDVRWAKERLA